jgi:aspartyl-tRNA synthetase
MERIFIKDAKQYIGEEVELKGFVHTIRDKGGIKFLLLRDVTGVIQAVITQDQAEVFAAVESLTTESVISLVGTVRAEERALGGAEVDPIQLTILSEADPELPIPIVSEKGGEETEMAKRFDWRWIDLRKPERLEIFKLWTSLEAGMREYLVNNGFLQIYSPSFMNAPSESGAEVFTVDYFERKAYLAQSPQFYKQMAMAAGFEKVFMVGPVFRAEPSFTSRHMTEFTGWDFEISYINSHYDVMAEEEKMLAYAFQKTNQNLGTEFVVPTIPFPKLTMAEAKQKLAQAGIPSEKEHDISPEEERAISELIKKETGHDFVFLTDYHISIRPFYHMRHEDQPERTKSFDLLYRGLEITTGAQREHRMDILKKQAVEKGMALEELENYINFFRYGCPPHGGVGIGPGRIIMQMLGLPNVKEATYLPRDVRRLTP